MSMNTTAIASVKEVTSVKAQIIGESSVPLATVKDVHTIDVPADAFVDP